MADLPIIFSAPMVRALLDGRKTMTRRLAMTQGKNNFRSDNAPVLLPSPWQRVKPGDRLWVREGWKPHSLYEAMKPRDIPQSKIFYLADDGYSPSGSRGRPSIHMPRRVSRLTLIVTATKIERLQDISENGAMAEGARHFPDIECRHPYPESAAHWSMGTPNNTDQCFMSARLSFARLWVDLHGPDAWDANPEVVALTFKPVLGNIDKLTKEAA